MLERVLTRLMGELRPAVSSARIPETGAGLGLPPRERSPSPGRLPAALSRPGQPSLRIRQLETELAVSRKVNEVFLEQGLPPKGSTR